MPDADKSLKIEIPLAATGQEQAQAVNDTLEQTAETVQQASDDSARYQAALDGMADKEETAKDGATKLNAAVREYAAAVKAAKQEMEADGGASIPENLAGKIGEGGTALGDEGESASPAGGKHVMLRRLMGELDRISPSLGESFRLVSDAHLAAGESSGGGAAGLKGFAAAMDTVLASLEPLLMAMLSVQAITAYWGQYKERVNAAADAHAAAMKKIQESTRGAMKAVQELDEAMHPKEHDSAAGAEAKAIRDKLDDLTGKAGPDATNAALNSGTNRQVFAIREQPYIAPTARDKVDGADQKYLATLEQAITGQRQTFASAVSLIQAQSSDHEIMTQMISLAHDRIDAVTRTLEQLQAQHAHARTNGSVND